MSLSLGNDWWRADRGMCRYYPKYEGACPGVVAAGVVALDDIFCIRYSG